MEILKFTLSGKGASFTRPHFNSIISTYSHIHKVAILGILGAIIGIEKDTNLLGLPSFYKELDSFKIAIVPHKKSFFSKNDRIVESTGFCNDGSNYVAIYQTLINPAWDIYIMQNNNDKYEEIKNKLLKNEAIYQPYLGRNHWFANIDNVEILEGNVIDISDIEKIDSLFDISNVETEENDDFLVERIYFKEFMPVGLHEVLFQYIEKQLVFTNDIIINSDIDLIESNNKILYFL